MGTLFFIANMTGHKTFSIFTTWNKATNYSRHPFWKQSLFNLDIMLLINVFLNLSTFIKNLISNIAGINPIKKPVDGLYK